MSNPFYYYAAEKNISSQKYKATHRYSLLGANFTSACKYFEEKKNKDFTELIVIKNVLADELTVLN